jgi:hypothetical protein
MNTAAQMAIGNRSRVLEDGPDVMNSDEEDTPKEEHGDVLEGMYTPGMDPAKGSVKLSQAQVAAQKAAAHAPKVPPRPNHRLEGVRTTITPTDQNTFGLKQKVACGRTSTLEKQQPTTKRPTFLNRSVNRHQ